MDFDTIHKVTFDGEWPIEGIRAALTGAKRAVLVAHTNADGDAVGSMLGMAAVLRHATACMVTPLLPDGCPDDLAWLPSSDTILSGTADTDRCREAMAAADLVVALDVNDFSRTGILAESLAASNARKVLIDHHIGPNQSQFDLIVSEHTASSTCELVYWTVREALGRDAIDRDAATCLYTGICTDTGTFSYSNDRPSIYMASAELMGYGIDPMEINRQIKNVFTLPRLRFFGHAMANLMKVYADKGVALMVITAADMKAWGVESSELTGLINEVMKLRDIDCGILVREETTCAGSKVRLSLRSKTQYDVNILAGELFGGGGHTRAAGATSLHPLDETVAIVKKHIGLED